VPGAPGAAPGDAGGDPQTPAAEDKTE
jgi:hypothetical protein